MDFYETIQRIMKDTELTKEDKKTMILAEVNRVNKELEK